MQLLGQLETTVKDKRSPAATGDDDEALTPQLVEPAFGDLVRVRPGVQPRYDWGDAVAGSVGRLTWFQEDRCVVDFPTHAGWNGLLSEMERVDPATVGPLPPQVGDRVRLRAGVAAPRSAAECGVNASSIGEVLNVLLGPCQPMRRRTHACISVLACFFFTAGLVHACDMSLALRVPFFFRCGLGTVRRCSR